MAWPVHFEHSIMRFHRCRHQGTFSRLLLFAGVLAGAWLGSVSCGAADKNGVSPNTISLPSGPGSVEGLGESFQPMLNTGTAKYSVGLRVPPGTAGHSPSVALVYDGGDGNGPLGLGWALPVAFIQRQCDKGIPRYIDDRHNSLDDDLDGEVDEADEVDVFINDLKEELVPQGDGTCFCENEGAFVRYRRQGESWEGILPDGTRLQFGLSASGRIAETTAGRVFKWLLERMTDMSGNTIMYSYGSFPGEENLNQKYLTAMTYGAGAPPWNNFHFVLFRYEDRRDWFEDGRAGFLVRTGKRLKEVVIATQGPVLAGHLAGDFNGDGTTDFLVRQYRLSYLQYDPTYSHWSLLCQVVPVGADGKSTLPASSFGYVVCNPPERVSARGQVVGGIDEPPFVMDNELVDLVDLNGDGLPDILKTEFSGGAHSGFLNLGEVETPVGRTIRWQAAAEVSSADGLAWNVNLQSPATVAHLADMDGDGLADLVCKTLLGDVFYFRNEGRLRWGERRAMSVLDFAPLSPFGNPNVKTADVDFDKRMDVIQSIDVGGGAVYRIWFNRGHQRYSYSQTVGQTSGFLFAQSGVHLADFNGDRVPDVVWLQPMTLTVTAGLGHGSFADPITLTIPGVTLDTDQVARARFEDTTGDGLVDLVLERAEPDQLWYWVNLGNYTLSGRKIITDMPTGLGQHPVIRWADLNGNGTTDLIYADSSSEPRLRTIDIGKLIGCAPRPHLLTSIDNGIGRVTTIRYEPSTRFALEDTAAGRPWPDPMPFPVHVVAAVTNADSLGHSYVTQYRYHDGYYDAGEKEFRGFARVEHIQPGDDSAPTLTTRSHFDTGRDFEAMKGKVLRLTAEQDDGRVFWDETTAWTIPPRILTTGTNGQTVNFAHPLTSAKTILELGQGEPRRLESEFAYDNYGNRTRTADYGIVVNGDRLAFNDERVTLTDYALNLERWILRAPKRQEVRNVQGSVVARVDYFYDDETFSGNNWGVVTAGNLTLRREWIDPANPAAYVNAARTKYDAYGNPTFLLDPLAPAPGGIIDPAQGHCSEVVYDERFHAYPICETIHVGSPSPPLAVHASYDEGLGTITSSLDFNGYRTSCGYDAFGRLIDLLKPGDNPAYPSAEYEYGLAQPTGASGLVNYVETRLLDRTPGSAGENKLAHYFRARSFVDGLGRKLLTKQEAESDPDTGAPRVAVSGAVQFNARSTVARVLNPFYSLNAGADIEALLAFEDISAPGWKGVFHDQGQLVALALASAHQTATRYDAALRSLETTHPDGANTRTVYEPLVTRAYDENDTDPASPHADTPHVFYADGLGRQIRTDEIVRLNDDGTPAAGLRTWTTTFQYDLNDQLTRITDSQGNVKRLQCDALKRKTFMDDPDRGKTTYDYDAASNLIRVTDNPGTVAEQVTVYGYDGANRTLSVDYLDEARPEISRHRQPDVMYHYDRPSAEFPTANNLAGRLGYVEDLSGAEFHSFDLRGNPEWKIKRIESLEGSRDFRTAFRYDVQDRLVEFIYPDGTIVTNVHNQGNQLAAIPGFLEAMTHLPSGQVQTERLGNGIVTEHAYNPRLWQMHLTTRHRDGGAPLQDYAYRFDPNGNIIEIVDAVGPDNGPGSADQIFQYDCLYRLTQAESPAYGALHYRYSPIGNLIAQRADSGDTRIDLGDYRYGHRIDVDGAGPHAAKDVAGGTHGPLSITYDATGNYRQCNGVGYSFDFAGRLVRARAPPQPGKDEFAAEYRYDYQSRRVLKRMVCGAATNETLYVEPEFEVRNDRHIKYIFAGGRRLAQVETREFRSPLAAGWNLLAMPVQPDKMLLNQVLSSVEGAWSAALYNKAAGSWTAIQSDDPETSNVTVHAGDAFWLYRPQAGEFRVVGSVPETASLSLDSGCSLFSTYINDIVRLDGLAASNSLAIWSYDNASKAWEIHANDPPVFSNMLICLQAAKAYWVRAKQPLTLPRRPTATVHVVFYHSDHLGSADFVADSSGQVVETTQFYPFGVERHTELTNALKTAYRYTGKEQDDETGLLYYGARYYDSALGRFVSPDPLYAEAGPLSQLLADPQKLSLYSYVRNNPVRFTDPTGLDDIVYDIFFRSPIEGSIEELKSLQAAAYGRAAAAWAVGRYGDFFCEAGMAFLAEAPLMLGNTLLRPANLANTLFGFSMGAAAPLVRLPPVTSGAVADEAAAAVAEGAAPAAAARVIPAARAGMPRYVFEEGGELAPQGVPARIVARRGAADTMIPSARDAADAAAAEAMAPAPLPPAGSAAEREFFMWNYVRRLETRGEFLLDATGQKIPSYGGRTIREAYAEAEAVARKKFGW